MILTLPCVQEVCDVESVLLPGLPVRGQTELDRLDS